MDQESVVLGCIIDKHSKVFEEVAQYLMRHHENIIEIDVKGIILKIQVIKEGGRKCFVD